MRRHLRCLQRAAAVAKRPSAAAVAWDTQAAQLSDHETRELLWHLSGEGDMARCQNILERLRHSGGLNSGVFVSMVRCCAAQGDATAAFRFVQECHARGLDFDAQLYLHLAGVLLRSGAGGREVVRLVQVFLCDARRFPLNPNFLDLLFAAGYVHLPVTYLVAVWSQALRLPLSYRAYLALAHGVLHSSWQLAEVVHPLFQNAPVLSLEDVLQRVEQDAPRHPQLSDSFAGLLLRDVATTIRLHAQREGLVLAQVSADVPIARPLARPAPLSQADLLRRLLSRALRQFRGGPEGGDLLRTLLSRMRRASLAAEMLSLWEGLHRANPPFDVLLDEAVVEELLAAASQLPDRQQAIHRVLERLTQAGRPVTPPLFVALLRGLRHTPLAVQLYHQSLTAGQPGLEPAAHSLALSTAFHLCCKHPAEWPADVPPPAEFTEVAIRAIGPLDGMAAVDRSNASRCASAFIALSITLQQLPRASAYISQMKELELDLGWKTLQMVRAAFIAARDVGGYHRFLEEHDLRHAFQRATPRPSAEAAVISARPPRQRRPRPAARDPPPETPETPGD